MRPQAFIVGLGIAAASVLPGAAAASHDDGSWSDRFATPDPSDQVTASVVYGGDLVIGGWFTQIGHVPAAYIARWDGSQWHELGAGLNGVVSALTIHNGYLYAGGTFTQADGLPAARIARWGGTSWTAVGAGMPGAFDGVSALLSAGGQLYAGGKFVTAGGNTVNNVARWDGANWNAMGSGLPTSVRALALHGGVIVAGGDLGLTPSSCVAQWNGTSWVAMGAGLTRFNTSLTPSCRSLLSTGTDLFAGGDFDKSGADSVRSVARWNGTQWLSTGVKRGIGFPVPVHSLAWFADSLTAATGAAMPGTSGNVVRWTGSTWISALPSDFKGSAYTLLPWNAQLVVGGLTATAKTLPSMNLARWSGTAWSGFGPWEYPMAGASSGGVSCMTTHQGQLIVAGFNRLADHSSWSNVRTIARWTGSRWDSLAPVPTVNPGIMASYAGDLYVGGRQNSSFQGLTRWNGSTWSELNAFGDVNALVIHGGQLVAGGNFGLENGANCLGSWNGTTWSDLGANLDPNTGAVRGLASFQGSLFVAGDFQTIGGIPAAHMARWDGTWHDASAGFPGISNSIGFAIRHDTLYAAVYSSPAVWRWNGASWVSVPGSPSNVERLAVYHDDLIVGTTDLHRWNGVTWATLGSGVDAGPTNSYAGAVMGMAVLDDTLFVGGTFTRAGGKASSNIAAWVDSVTPVAVPGESDSRLSLAIVGANPFRERVSFAYTLSAPSPTRIAVHDAAGRIVATLVHGPQTAGAHTVAWNGRDGTGRTVPAGLYFVRLNAERAERVVRVVRLR